VDREPPGGTAIFITAHHLKKKKNTAHGRRHSTARRRSAGGVLVGRVVQSERWLGVWEDTGGATVGGNRVRRCAPT
jgi:hypothetical protein